MDTAPRADPAATQSEQPRKRTVITLLAIMTIVAAALSITAAARIACISRDGAGFVRFARGLAADPRTALTAELSQPAYPAALLGVRATLGGALADEDYQAWTRSGQLIAGLGFVACVPLVFLLTRRIFDDRTGLIAAGLMALWPHALQLSGDVLSDVPHVALFLAATVAGGALILHGRPWHAVVFGLIASAAYYVRQEALALPIALALCAAWHWRHESISPARRIIALVLVAVSFVGPIVPYFLVTGRIGEKNIRDLIPRDSAPPKNGATAPAFGVVTPPPAARFAPFSGRFGIVLKMLLSFAHSGRYVFSTLFVIGLVASARPAAPVWRVWLTVLIALQCLAVVARGAALGEVSARYMLIPVALTLPWAAAGMDRVLQWFAHRFAHRKPRPWPVITWIAAWGMVAAILLPRGLRPVNQEDAWLRDAGLFLRQRCRPQDQILAERRLSRVLYYVEGIWNIWPDVHWSPQTLADRDRLTRARWYVQFDEDGQPAGYSDALIAFVLSNPTWPRARLVHDDRDPRDKRIRIVELRPLDDPPSSMKAPA